METGKNTKSRPSPLPENWLLNMYQHTAEEVYHKTCSCLSSSPGHSIEKLEAGLMNGKVLGSELEDNLYSSLQSQKQNLLLSA